MTMTAEQIEQTQAEPDGPIVWIVQNSKRLINGELVSVHDTSKAERFGERQYILDERVKPWNPDIYLPAIRDKMVRFDAAQDFLLLIGSPVYIAMAFALAADQAASLGHTHLRLLYWQGTKQDYSEIVVPLKSIVDNDWNG